MNDQSKFIAGLLLGAAAGAAIAYLLTTDKGKELVEELKAVVSEAGEEIKDTASQWANDAQTKANSFTS